MPMRLCSRGCAAASMPLAELRIENLRCVGSRGCSVLARAQSDLRAPTVPARPRSSRRSFCWVGPIVSYAQHRTAHPPWPAQPNGIRPDRRLARRARSGVEVARGGALAPASMARTPSRSLELSGVFAVQVIDPGDPQARWKGPRATASLAGLGWCSTWNQDSWIHWSAIHARAEATKRGLRVGTGRSATWDPRTGRARRGDHRGPPNALGRAWSRTWSRLVQRICGPGRRPGLHAGLGPEHSL